MDITCISDLHGHYPQLEGGNLLIVAGDLTARDDDYEYWQFNKWIKDQAYEYEKVIVIAGNHDNLLIQTPNRHMAHVYCHPAEYLCDSGTDFEGLKIWGTPWTKTFEGMNPHCKAFTFDTEEELAEKWKLIPDNTDILVTHSPPYGILDKTIFNERVGSKSLSHKIGLNDNPPKLWVWGHIHEAYGKDLPVRGKNCIMVNASHVNEFYKPVNHPVRIIL